MTQCWGRGCLLSPSLCSSRLVLFFLGGSRKKPEIATTLLFLYEALKQQSFSWWANMDDSPGSHEEVLLSGSLQLEYWAPCMSGAGDRLYNQASRTQLPPWSLSWQRCLFPSHLPGLGALSQMPDDLHRPANRAAKPKCFPKAFWEAREKGKHDCQLWSWLVIHTRAVVLSKSVE